jgi:gluconate 2-dehydrogenase gamma chain
MRGMPNIEDRRAFLRAAAAAGVAWAGADLLQVQEALASAARQAATGGAGRLEALTQAQAATIDALTSRILPSVDGRAGAHEAGVLYFIDRALATFNAGQKTLYAAGIADLDKRAVRKWKDAAGFAALTAEQQDHVIRDIEKTPFFAAARFDTLCGAFALPVWGGNRGHSGWHMLGLTHQPAFQPPFGYYDTDAERGR